MLKFRWVLYGWIFFQFWHCFFLSVFVDIVRAFRDEPSKTFFVQKGVNTPNVKCWCNAIIRDSFINQFKLVHKLIANFLTSKLIQFSLKIQPEAAFFHCLASTTTTTTKKWFSNKITVNLCEIPKRGYLVYKLKWKKKN